MLLYGCVGEPLLPDYLTDGGALDARLHVTREPYIEARSVCREQPWRVMTPGLWDVEMCRMVPLSLSVRAHFDCIGIINDRNRCTSTATEEKHCPMASQAEGYREITVLRDGLLRGSHF